MGVHVSICGIDSMNFFKAHQLSSLLDQQEQALRQTPAGYDSPGADPVIRDYDAVGGQYSFPSSRFVSEIKVS